MSGTSIIAQIFVSLSFMTSRTGVQIRVSYQKLIFLFLNQKQMLWVLKRTVSMRRFV